MVLILLGLGCAALRCNPARRRDRGSKGKGSGPEGDHPICTRLFAAEDRGDRAGFLACARAEPLGPCRQRPWSRYHRSIGNALGIEPARVETLGLHRRRRARRLAKPAATPSLSTDVRARQEGFYIAPVRPSNLAQALTWPKASCCHSSGVRSPRTCESSTKWRTLVGPYDSKASNFSAIC